MQGKETNKKGKGRVDKAMLPTGGQSVSTEGAGGLPKQALVSPLSQDRGSHGVVHSIHLTWAPA